MMTVKKQIKGKQKKKGQEVSTEKIEDGGGEKGESLTTAAHGGTKIALCRKAVRPGLKWDSRDFMRNTSNTHDIASQGE